MIASNVAPRSHHLLVDDATSSSKLALEINAPAGPAADAPFGPAASALRLRRKTPMPGEHKDNKAKAMQYMRMLDVMDKRGGDDAAAPPTPSHPVLDNGQVLFVATSPSSHGHGQAIVRRPTIRLARDNPMLMELSQRRNTGMPQTSKVMAPMLKVPPIPHSRSASIADDPLTIALPASQCIVTGCTNPSANHDLCTLHYQRALRIHNQINPLPRS
ncbi:SCA7 domain-containing protein [Plasmodiophora brassicae]